MRFRDWVLVYLGTGSTFTRWAILAFYGGAVVVIAFLLLFVLCCLVRDNEQHSSLSFYRSSSRSWSGRAGGCPVNCRRWFRSIAATSCHVGPGVSRQGAGTVIMQYVRVSGS